MTLTVVPLALPAVGVLRVVISRVPVGPDTDTEGGNL